MEPVYIGSFDKLSKGEEKIYEMFRYKRDGILTQFSSSKTLEGAKKIAMKWPGNSKAKCFIIHHPGKDKYLLYF